MRRRLLLVLTIGPALAGLDLATKALVGTEPWFFDRRTQTWFVLSIAVLCGSLLLALLPSRSVVAASTLLAGGVLGNLLSALHHDGRVPNPFVVWGARGGIAFNLADTFVLSGIVLQTVALSVVTIRYRHILPRSFVATRIARRVRARRTRS